MKVFVAITSSIAAYRSVDLVRQLKASGLDLDICLSSKADRFVGRTTLETFGGKKILSNDLFADDKIGTDHIHYARTSDVMLVYGATANTLAKIAHGMADDFISTQILATKNPVILAPAMNTQMWEAAATHDNMKLLKKRGFIFVGPIPGDLACGEKGLGHIADIDEIVNAVQEHSLLRKLPNLHSKKVLISLGSMSSPIDLARRLQNESSGLMGLELARSFRASGAEVTLLAGHVDQNFESALKSFPQRRFSTPAQYKAGLDELFSKSNLFISAAAVLDFEVLSSDRKYSREEIAQHQALTLPIRAVPDFVADATSKAGPHQKIVAFALESGHEREALERARQKMQKKKVHALIANRFSSSSGPNARTNEVWLLTPENSEAIHFTEGKKSALAKNLVSEIARKLFIPSPTKGSEQVAEILESSGAGLGPDSNSFSKSSRSASMGTNPQLNPESDA